MIQLALLIFLHVNFSQNAYGKADDAIEVIPHIPEVLLPSIDNNNPSQASDIDEEAQAETDNHIIEEQEITNSAIFNNNADANGSILHRQGVQKKPNHIYQNENWQAIHSANFCFLDKVTGKTIETKLKIGEEFKFQKLRVILHYAAKSKPFASTNICVFIEIFEEQQNKEWLRYFSGWIFAANLSLSALNHPVYDVWPIDPRFPY